MNKKSRIESADALDENAVRMAVLEVMSSPETLSNLLWRASVLCGGSEYGADDLLQEAVTQALDLRRRCRRNLAFIVFLRSAMKSIADNNRKHAYLAKREAVADDEALLQLDSRRACLPSMEEVLLASEELAAWRVWLDRALCNDGAARRLVELLLKGRDKAGIRAVMGLSDTAYNSLRRRVRRKIGSLPGVMVGRRR